MRRRCIFAVIVLLTFTPNIAFADARTDVMAGIAQCASVVDNRAWLDCVYGAAQPMRALLGLPPAPQWHPAPNQSVAGSPAPFPQDQGAASFGDRVPSRLSAGVREKMASYRFDANHHFTVVLADGQIWSQLS